MVGLIGINFGLPKKPGPGAPWRISTARRARCQSRRANPAGVGAQSPIFAFTETYHMRGALYEPTISPAAELVEPTVR